MAAHLRELDERARRVLPEARARHLGVVDRDVRAVEAVAQARAGRERVVALRRGGRRRLVGALERGLQLRVALDGP